MAEATPPLLVDPRVKEWLESPVGAGQDASVAGTVVLTAYFTATKDPQRGRFVKESFRFMHKWHRSLSARKLRGVVFHDGLSKAFVKKHENEYVRFHRAQRHAPFSTNDDRFIIYLDFLKKVPALRYVLMADISDVFFNANPFEVLVGDPAYASNHDLFAMADREEQDTNGWMVGSVRKCYGGTGTQFGHRQLWNAGVFGGTRPGALALMGCAVNELYSRPAKTRPKNCNMPAFNKCINQAQARRLTVLSTHGGDIRHAALTNPMRERCDDARFIIVHDKCGTISDRAIAVGADGLVRRCRQREVCAVDGANTTRSYHAAVPWWYPAAEAFVTALHIAHKINLY